MKHSIFDFMLMSLVVRKIQLSRQFDIKSCTFNDMGLGSEDPRYALFHDYCGRQIKKL